MVHSGRIYETDGAAPVAVHLAEDIRPLSPIPHAPSLRFFRTDRQIFDGEGPTYAYGNPSSVIGPSQEVTIPDHVGIVGADAFIAVAAVSDAFGVAAEDADDHVLGVTLMIVLSARDLERTGDFARAYDIASALGPVITTPEELDDFLIATENGRHYRLNAIMRVNGLDKDRNNVEELPFSGAQAIATASLSSPVRAGDIFAIGPIVSVDEIGPGDEVQFIVENLGTLSLKITP